MPLHNTSGSGCASVAMHPAKQTDECMELAERRPIPSYYFTIMRRHSRGMTADDQAQAPTDGGCLQGGGGR